MPLSEAEIEYATAVTQCEMSAPQEETHTGSEVVAHNIVHPIVRNRVESRVSLSSSVRQIGDADTRHRTVARERKLVAGHRAITRILGEKDPVASDRVKERIRDLNMLRVLNKNSPRPCDGPVPSRWDFIALQLRRGRVGEAHATEGDVARRVGG